jgi:23S rRNA (cytidine1920-2'-O)/16S rRNA (cytidine1409-2'-O)-methyltransferase
VVLVKPQFEAGRAALSKGGIVRAPAARAAAVAKVREWLGTRPDWRVVGEITSPVLGGSGNKEFLIGAVRDE